MNQVQTPIKQREHFRKNHFETQAWANGGLVCGIDEVGRGCLAGPLVTAAVMLPAHKTSPLLKDSKIMSKEEREKAALWIKKHCWYGIGTVHHRLVDRHNIWHATLIAMKRALVNLLSIAPVQPSTIVIDAMPLKLFDTGYGDIPVYYFPFGERRSSSIAAASIIAKVHRDALITRMDDVFTGFNLGQHKGYGTPLHKKALRDTHSPLIIHRRSYIKHVFETESAAVEEQQGFLDESPNEISSFLE